MEKKKSLNKKKYSLTIMRKEDRQILFSVVGFLGGVLSIQAIIPEDVSYKPFILIGVGLLFGLLGYGLATD